VRVAVIGAGPGGLCSGKRLLDEGIDDFVIIERSDDVGGTWFRNTYPGCECDVPSALYSFSFDCKLDWSKPYGTQPEILEYMRGIADKFGLRPYCRFGDGVESARWDDATARWTLTLSSGATIEADAVISAVGMFGEPSWPDIEGLDSFAGAVWHSAQWNWDHPIDGDRVAVIGSAASAVQFVPEIVKVAGQVHLFQRTANWVAPKVDDPYTDEQLERFRADPSKVLAFRTMVFERTDKGMTFADPTVLAENEANVLAAISQVRDPEVRRKLVPEHPYGCKRPLFSNKYYPAFNEPNLELVTDAIARITPTGVVTADGVEREVDTIVVATGFSTTRYVSAIDVVGRDGQHINDAWHDGPLAYLGITTAGFPNLFMLYGPNTNNGSILTMIEHQVDHILLHLQRLAADGAAWVDVRPEPMQRYNDEVQAAIAGVRVWNAGCPGYYRTPSGRIVTQWPFSMTDYERRTATLDDDAFEFGAPSASAS
jgi:cation diffusion facilitator CzcD-associated flavoprotein CzcO